jgi:RNA polymerase sigma factor (sigma-70 family)
MPYISQQHHTGPAQMSWQELLSACARDRGNSALWAEFLGRYDRKIRYYIKDLLQRTVGKMSAAETSGILGGMQCSDLFQSTIVRLVENDCAALRKFSGSTESDWLAYLAVVTRSVVRESLRRQRALKRPGGADGMEPPVERERGRPGHPEATRELERTVLAREVRKLGERAINDGAGEAGTRDLLIFSLYFDHDLSLNQISQCQGIKLSKTGVEKALTRLKELVRSAVSEESSKEIAR